MNEIVNIDQSSESKALELVEWIVDKAIQGVPPLLSSTEELANEYLQDLKYKNNDERVDALIKWETAKNFSTGFVTGLGGLLTLPISIPSALGACWIIQARMAGAIAIIYGHNIKEDRVKTLVILSILGDGVKEVLKEVGVQIGEKFTKNLIMKIPGRVLKEINKKVGFRLLTKAGEKGVINLIKIVPIVGGVISGVFDASSCYSVGKIAKEIFRKSA